MKAQNPSYRRLGITRRIALLSWLVTIVTLVIFLVVIVPEQKRTYVENLESKARGVSASLQDVTAGAVVTEDYSSVVDHCKQVLQGDRSIAFLVITKNDGFSLIHSTGGLSDAVEGNLSPPEAQWRIDTLGDYWHPAARKPKGGIDTVPVFDQRLFHYAKPFDYSGIEWGWIHVGLSLDAYDQSVEGVYRRTGLLAVLCLFFSLIASVVYASRLVRPLHDLNDVVSQVAAGDLRARADIRSRDEIQDLAQSFNTMTEGLLRRDRILESVRFAAQQFLSTSDWRTVVEDVLEKIGRAADASRAYVCKNDSCKDGPVLACRRFEWVADGIEQTLSGPAHRGCDYAAQGFGRWIDLFQRGEIVSGIVAKLPPSERPMFEGQGILSIMAIPIHVGDAWWGFLGLDDCARERQWTDAEHDSLRAAADMLGAAIARRHTQEALLEAKATLEHRVQERTKELEEQMAAKEKAHVELADAQHRLIETSRMAGMAEVATGVLHNVGNVLNTVNLSVSQLRERLDQVRLRHLRQAVTMLNEQNGNLAQFLQSDPRGKALPGFLLKLTNNFEQENRELQNEAGKLVGHVEHIKEIVSTQQSHARVMGVIEQVAPAFLVEAAIKLTRDTFSRHQVEILTSVEDLPQVLVDRHKVVQILVNLLTNAKDSICEAGPSNRHVVVEASIVEDSQVSISVTDSGVGISPENLSQIFRHGFTTKVSGHGYGLHASAIAAQEMKGSLSVHSDGIGKGATFTVKLPMATGGMGSAPSLPMSIKSGAAK